MSTLIAQPLKFHVAGGNVPLSIPMMHSMLESGSFILSLLAWVSFSLYRRGRVTIDNWRYRVKVYALMGLLDCVRYNRNVWFNIVFLTLGIVV